MNLVSKGMSDAPRRRPAGAKRVVRTSLLLALAAFALSACAPSIAIYGEPRSVVWGSSYGSRPGRTVDIPPGHMPPAGMCRIWFPGRPPGQQPPPGECHDLEQRLPPDGVLVYG